jgi:hypothetical protein
LTKLEISVRANSTRHLGNFSLLFQDWVGAMASNDTAEAQRLRGELAPLECESPNNAPHDPEIDRPLISMAREVGI